MIGGWGRSSEAGVEAGAVQAKLDGMVAAVGRLEAAIVELRAGRTGLEPVRMRAEAAASLLDSPLCDGIGSSSLHTLAWLIDVRTTLLSQNNVQLVA